jgi:uncharacterized protein YcfJ
MAYIIEALFRNSKAAGMAVADLKAAGFANNISVITKNWQDTQVKTRPVEDKDAVIGPVIGAVVGDFAGLLATTGAVAVPGLSLVLVAGPVTTLMTVAGVLSGGLAGFLVKSGISPERAKKYEGAVKRGEVLVIIMTNSESEDKIKSILKKHLASQIYVRD